MTTSAYKQNLPKQQEAIKSFRFGVEIETIGVSREKLARGMAKALGLVDSAVSHEGGTYDKWIVTCTDGRKWTLMSDASLSTGYSGAEIVTPILTYADMEMLQVVIRSARASGARVDESCGVHVHVESLKFAPADLERLAKLVYQQEDLLVQALGVRPSRLAKWCKKVDENFMNRLRSERSRDQRGLADLWYAANVDTNGNARSAHYHGSRYHGLNMHSVFYRGTIEFRYFEGTLHAGEIKSYVQLCLALAARATESNGRVLAKRKPSTQSAKYDWRCFTLRLGMIGDEFKTAREHLMKRLPGCSAWKNGRPQVQATPSEPKPEVLAPMAA